MQTFDQMEFKAFVAELKKQKIKLSLAQQDEWEDYFNQYRNDCQQLSEQIAGTDREIDLRVYQLYGLTYDEVKKALQNGCTTDAFTAKAPLRWGFGKIDAKKGLEYILSSAGIEDVLRPTPDEQPAIYYDLQGRRVKNPSRGVYIVNGKKVAVH